MFEVALKSFGLYCDFIIINELYVVESLSLPILFTYLPNWHFL